MFNPTLSKKTDTPLTPNDDSKKLFQAIYKKQNKKESGSDDVQKINVSDLVSKMSFYYEKIRNSVDYKEDNLLRKNAIERILKRHIVIENVVSLKDVNSQDVSRHLLVELIRAGYMPNNSIPESKIDEFSVVIAKYLQLKKYFLEYFREKKIQERNEMSNWVLSLCATDLEERIGRSDVDNVLVAYMYDILTAGVKFENGSEYEKDRDIQIYIGIHSTMMKYDHSMVSFLLFKYFNAGWDSATDEQVKEVAVNIFSLKAAIDGQIHHPITGQLRKIISRYTVYFTMLMDVIEDDCVGIYNSFSADPKAFPHHIKRVCEVRYKGTKKKLWRAAIRSLIYVFITKSILAFVLEVPVTKWLGEELNTTSLMINIAFPVALLFVVVALTKLPSKENSEKIVSGIEEIVFIEKKRTEPIVMRQPIKQGGLMNAIFGIIYAATFLTSFGAVVWALQKINFHFVSITIFLFFLALISFFGIRIRRNTRELIVIPPRENILNFILDFFYVPVIAVGKWLSEKFSQVNVFVFILDFIIEAPFKIFVEIAEEWTKYVKNRKDEIS
ncbi:hypothetical protein L6270_03330 [Candidatus Parcubacteria bacterium]|nr:hypothetical protein [Patescibacteria group bacterium]MBU4308997.1 hypothetical protein [Patescibacteria group bacterium]MBU4577357.1 hypothetical protein [Patescibacteria group bacterium]MCG2697045.1 hypothetical protein [Candidatus Parcubacteria bacterium]